VVEHLRCWKESDHSEVAVELGSSGAEVVVEERSKEAVEETGQEDSLSEVVEEVAGQMEVGQHLVQDSIRSPEEMEEDLLVVHR